MKPLTYSFFLFLAILNQNPLTGQPRQINNGNSSSQMSKNMDSPPLLADYVEPVTEEPNSGGKPTLIGEINYTTKTIEAIGVAFLNPNHLANGRDYAVELARVGAEATGRANLLKVIKKVRIVDTVKVEDQLGAKRITIETIEGWVRAMPSGDPIVTDNKVTVKMRLILDSEASSLEKELLNSVDVRKVIPEKSKDAPSDELIQKEIDQIKNPIEVVVEKPADGKPLPKPGLVPNRIRVIGKDGQIIWSNYLGKLETKDLAVNEMIDVTVKRVLSNGKVADLLKKCKGKIADDGAIEIKVADVFSGKKDFNETFFGKYVLPGLINAGKLILGIPPVF